MKKILLFVFLFNLIAGLLQGWLPLQLPGIHRADPEEVYHFD